MNFKQFAVPRPFKRAESSKNIRNYNVFVIPIFALSDGSRGGRCVYVVGWGTVPRGIVLHESKIAAHQN